MVYAGPPLLIPASGWYFIYFIYFYFISFALKNTKKKNNTEDMQTLVIRT